MTDTANAPEREAGTPGPHEPDYKTAMLYHSDRADAYMGERDALTAELAKLRADLAEAQAKIARLTEALKAEHAYWVKCADADWAEQDLHERLAEYPIMRKMTEAMRKADALSAALQENANG